MTDPRQCSDCGTALTELCYGYEGCGPHLLSDFIEKPGYKMPLPACFSTWDGGDDDFVIAVEDLPEPTPIWLTAEKCCARWILPEADETDYCPKCEDVMEPARAFGTEQK